MHTTACIVQGNTKDIVKLGQGGKNFGRNESREAIPDLKKSFIKGSKKRAKIMLKECSVTVHDK